MSNHDSDRTRSEIEQLQERIQQLEQEKHRANLELARVTRIITEQERVAAIGAWELELPSMKLWWSDEVFRMHELPLGEPPDAETAISFYLDDAADEMRSLLERCIDRGEPFDVELPMTTATGRPIWIRAVGELARADIGQGTRLCGVFQDITDRHEADEELRANQERLWYAIHGSEDGVWDWQVASGEVYFSPRWKEIVGYADDEMANEFVEWDSRLHVEDRDRVMESVQRALAGEIETYSCEFRMQHRDGSWCWILARGKVVAREAEGAALRMVGTHTDISDEVLMREELLHAKEGAEAAARAKAQFLTTMSHEIRTPMNGVLGMAQLLLNSDLDEEPRSFARTIFESGSSLLSILNDVLDHSKIEAGKIEFEAIEFDLHQVLEEVVQLHSVEARSKELSLGLDFQGDLSTQVVGDPGRLRQIMLNLVGNAVKFTDTGGVEVRARQEFEATSSEQGTNGMIVRFDVVDTGVGIAPAARSSLFQPFSQEYASTTRKFGGTGLGLSICHRLAELMGGSIGVESEEGRGSTFWLALPFEVREGAGHGQQPKSSSGVDWPTFPSARVLVVEDNAVNRVVARKTLERLGLRVELAEDGREALELTKKQDFALILMDCQMPEMDGFESTQRIREHELRQGISPTPIVAMTANALSGDRARCLAAGMDDYVAKPVEVDALVSTLERFIPVRDRPAA